MSFLNLYTLRHLMLYMIQCPVTAVLLKPVGALNFDGSMPVAIPYQNTVHTTQAYHQFM